MKKTIKCFIHLNIKDLGENRKVENCVSVASVDYSTFSEDYVNVREIDLEYELPENLLEVGVASLEAQLKKMRADNYRKEQALIDSIAGLRLLAAPKEGEVMDDRDLVNPEQSVSRLDDDAEDASFTDIPF